MATAEYAQLQTEQLQAEQVSALRFPHWSAVRWCAALLYAVALAAYTAAYGIPVQRELVIAWTCGALAVASIGRPPRDILQLVLDWAPIVAVLAVYDFTRGAADSMGIGVHDATMIDFDQFVFFGETPTEWLQAHLYEPGVVHWYDVAFTLVYTSYFIVPFATAGVLWRATGSPSCASPSASSASRSPASRPTSPSPRRRRGWRAKKACSTASTGRPPMDGK